MSNKNNNQSSKYLKKDSSDDEKDESLPRSAMIHSPVTLLSPEELALMEEIEL